MFFDQYTATAVRTTLRIMGYTAVMHKYGTHAYAVYVSATNDIMDEVIICTPDELRAYIQAQHTAPAMTTTTA